MTLSREPPPAPCLRFRPARRWAAGGPCSRAGQWVWGRGAPCWSWPGVGTAPGVMWWVLVGGTAGAVGASVRPHHTPSAARGQGHRAGLRQAPGVGGSEWGDQPALLPGESRATHAVGWELRGSAEPALDAQEGPCFTLCPTARPPETPKQSQNRAGGRTWGDPCAGRCSSASFSCPPCQGAWVLQDGSGPALPGVSCVGQPQGPDEESLLWVTGVQLTSSPWGVWAPSVSGPLIPRAPVQGPSWGKQEEPVTNLWQRAHELPVNKSGPPVHPPAVLVTVAQP